MLAIKINKMQKRDVFIFAEGMTKKGKQLSRQIRKCKLSDR